ncbi:MAG: hypothetical protein M3R38_33265, partial [Actinomycetota bacterium]|nr:hypothetical protein [Actinomycetota bacterium]
MPLGERGERGPAAEGLGECPGGLRGLFEDVGVGRIVGVGDVGDASSVQVGADKFRERAALRGAVGADAVQCADGEARLLVLWHTFVARWSSWAYPPGRVTTCGRFAMRKRYVVRLTE